MPHCLKFAIFAALLSIFLGLAARPASAAILLTLENPGFEDGLVDWTFNNFTITTDSANSGANAIQAGSFPIATASQAVDVDSFAGGIDLGGATVDVDYFVHGQDNFDFYTVSIEFFDGLSGAGTLLDSATRVGPISRHRRLRRRHDRRRFGFSAGPHPKLRSHT